MLERAAGVAMVAAFALVPVGVWLGTPLLPGWTIAPGLALVVLGTADTFRWIRNPIFTMMIVASVGLALVCSTPLVLATPAVLVAALELQVRLVEEPWLRSVHGARYLSWAARTGRFLPGVGCMRA